MGVYDTVNLPCPQCGATVPLQTKAGPCQLKEFSPDNAPLEVLSAVAGRECTCSKCGVEFVLVVGRPMTTTAKIYPKSDDHDGDDQSFNSGPWQTG